MIIKDYNQPIVSNGSFTWAEFTYLKGFKLFTNPSEQEYQNALFLFSQLELLRKQLGYPLIISSGVRTADYTQYLRKKGIPAAINSTHNTWQAVDLICPKLSTKKLWDFFDSRWSGRMELLHYTPTWVHIDTRNWGSHQRFAP